MAARKPASKKKFFTVTQANAALPLVRVIVRDIIELARDLQERHDRFIRVLPSDRRMVGDAHREELDLVQADLEREQERLREYFGELEKLGVEMKDFKMGLVDFPSWMDNREVSLCWRLGEAEVSFWHELDAGFAGRKKLMVGASPS